MMFMTTYIFACFGIELVYYTPALTEDPETVSVMEEKFSSVFVTMLTLCQFVTVDGVSDVYWPLVMKEWYFMFYFAAVWLVLSVVLMNLITAVILENAIAQGGEDREMHRNMLRRKIQLFKPIIESIFQKLDKDGDGKLKQSELQVGIENIIEDLRNKRFGHKIPHELKDVIVSDELADLFVFLDDDGSGTIDKHEFLNGISYLALKSVPTETIQTLFLLRSHTETLAKIRADLRAYGEMLTSIRQKGSTCVCQGEAPQQSAQASTTWAL
jgi:Ca2+-binding EF-hand superfamily protein